VWNLLFLLRRALITIAFSKFIPMVQQTFQCLYKLCLLIFNLFLVSIAWEIKAHPFFKGLDWTKLRQMKSPFIPIIKDEEDCSRFDDFEEEDPFWPVDDGKSESPSK